jgi:hypothetical protein
MAVVQGKPGISLKLQLSPSGFAEVIAEYDGEVRVEPLQFLIEAAMAEVAWAAQRAIREAHVEGIR